MRQYEDRSRPGMKGVGFANAREAEDGFAVESGVNTDGKVYVRVWVGGVKQVMGIRDGWTVVRLLSEALAAAEADALVYQWAKRTWDEEKAAAILGMMRDERERADVSSAREHFYERIREDRRQ